MAKARGQARSLVSNSVNHWAVDLNASVVRSRPLSQEDWAKVDQFHALNLGVIAHWRGFPIVKSVFDLWIYQDVIYETKRDTIIECGTAMGGSALFFANMLDLNGHGQVITIDQFGNTRDACAWLFGQEAAEHLADVRPEHPRIRYLTGHSLSPTILDEVNLFAFD